MPPVMGSHSLPPRRFWGLPGKVFNQGGYTQLRDPQHLPRSFSIPEGLIPALWRQNDPPGGPRSPGQPIHEENFFTFLNSTYEVTQRNDRWAACWRGLRCAIKEARILFPIARAFGSIQVPGSGQPIILMADRQTTGGYVKIATVISVDLPLIAQALPGYQVRFEAIGLKEAQDLLIEREKKINDWVSAA